MGFRTIDLDTKEGMEKYKKLKETKSIQETFGNDGIEKFAPRPEESKQEDTKIEMKINAPVEMMGVVRGVSQLRVREKPEGDVLFLISEKSVVKIIEEYEGWYKVETAPGRVGFVMRQFIEVRTEGG
jgi:hypothetical protein